MKIKTESSEKLARGIVVNKVLETFLDDAEYVKELAQNAVSCGAINMDDYEEKEYALPKIILHTIYKRLAEQRKPPYQTHVDEAQNLSHFI